MVQLTAEMAKIFWITPSARRISMSIRYYCLEVAKRQHMINNIENDL